MAAQAWQRINFLDEMVPAAQPLFMAFIHGVHVAEAQDFYLPP